MNNRKVSALQHAVLTQIFRKSANRTVPKHEPFFRDFNIGKLNLIEFIRKARTVPRCEF
jgi:hypothetical protein